MQRRLHLVELLTLIKNLMSSLDREQLFQLQNRIYKIVRFVAIKISVGPRAGPPRAGPGFFSLGRPLTLGPRPARPETGPGRARAGPKKARPEPAPTRGLFGFFDVFLIQKYVRVFGKLVLSNLKELQFMFTLNNATTCETRSLSKLSKNLTRRSLLLIKRTYLIVMVHYFLSLLL